MRFFINDVGRTPGRRSTQGQRRRRLRLEPTRGPVRQRLDVDCGPPPTGITDPSTPTRTRPAAPRSPAAPSCPTARGRREYDGTYLYSDFVCGKIVQLVPSSRGGYTAIEFATNLKHADRDELRAARTRPRSLLRDVGCAPPASTADLLQWHRNRPPDAVAGASPVAGDLPLTVTSMRRLERSRQPDPLTTTGTSATARRAARVTSRTRMRSPGTYTAKLTVDRRTAAKPTATRFGSTPGTTPRPGDPDPGRERQVQRRAGHHAQRHRLRPRGRALPASALTWTVVKHHATHTHPFLAPTAGTGFTSPLPSPRTSPPRPIPICEIILTATDSRGLTRR